jgi:hypothetical protein
MEEILKNQKSTSKKAGFFGFFKKWELVWTIKKTSQNNSGGKCKLFCMA